jgi:hypothetical protein
MGHEGPYFCEALRVPHYLDIRLIDGGKVVSLTHRPRFTAQEYYLINSWYSFLLEERLGQLEKSNDLIGN